LAGRWRLRDRRDDQHGWSSPETLQRYGRANREQRAIDEARKLKLGEL
jgi:hypothetical protein